MLGGALAVAASVACSSRDDDVASAALAPDASVADASSQEAGGDAARPALDAADAKARPDPCVGDAGDATTIDLECTGLYADFATKTLSPGVRPYAPGLPFWSDGAEKARWIMLPPGSKIDSADMDGWVFPVGTKLWKEFKLAGKRIETRMYWKRSASPNGWVAATFRWSASEDAAPRLDTGEKNVNGTTYEVPDEGACDQCHGGRKDKVLGFEAIGLAHPSATGVTLAQLVKDGLLTVAPAKTALALPEDATGKAAPALGWLHANCGTSCHNASPDAAASFIGLRMRLNATQLLAGDAGTVSARDVDAFKTAVNVDVLLSPYKTQGGWKRIKPHDASKSLVHFLSTAKSGGVDRNMPPLAVHTPDPTGTALVGAWINAMQAPDGGM